MTRILPSLLLSILALSPVAAGAEEPAASGEVLYRRYCASCHGVAGGGDGPAAPALAPPPTNLTTLAMDEARLMRVIDGRTNIRAHSTSAMPVWGTIFEQGLLPDAHAKRTALLQVQALADYVVRLAKKAPAHR